MGNRQSTTVFSHEKDLFGIQHIPLSGHKATQIYGCKVISISETLAMIVTVGRDRCSKSNPFVAEINVWFVEIRTKASKKKSFHVTHKLLYEFKLFVRCCDIHHTGKYIAIAGGREPNAFTLLTIDGIEPLYIDNLNDINFKNIQLSIKKRVVNVKSKFLGGIDRVNFWNCDVLADNYNNTKYNETSRLISLNYWIIADFLSGKEIYQFRWTLLMEQLSGNIGNHSNMICDNCVMNNNWVFLLENKITLYQHENIDKHLQLNPIDDNNSDNNNSNNISDDNNINHKTKILKIGLNEYDLSDCSEIVNNKQIDIYSNKCKIKYSPNGKLFCLERENIFYMFKISNNSDKEIELIDTYCVMDGNEFDENVVVNVSCMEWIDENRLLYCLKIGNNKYKLYWLRSLKFDKVRLQVLLPYLMNLKQLCLIILEMIGFERSNPIDSNVCQEMKCMSVIPMNKQKSFIVCLGSISSKVRDALDAVMVTYDKCTC